MSDHLPRQPRDPLALLGRALACGAVGGFVAGGALTAPDLRSETWRGLFPLGLVLGTGIGLLIALAVGLSWLALTHYWRRRWLPGPLIVFLLTLLAASLLALIIGGPGMLAPSPLWLVLAYAGLVATATTRYITTRRVDGSGRPQEEPSAWSLGQTVTSTRKTQ